MGFIGKEPQTGAYNMLDNLSASATASYSLTLDSTAFVPESANHLLVSLNGVIQKAGSSYTVSGSTLTFSSSLASSDSIDFVLALGNVLDIGTPSDATVTNAKTNFVSTSSAAGLQIKGDGTTDGTLQLNCSQNSHGIKLKSPAHSTSSSYTLTFPGTDPSADKILQTDGSGNLSFVDAPSGGLVHLATTTATSNVSQAVLDNVFSSTYDNYMCVFDATVDSQGADLIMHYRTGGSSGSNFTTSNTYRYAFKGYDSGGNDESGNGVGNSWQMGHGTYGDENIDPPGVHGVIFFNSPHVTNTQTTWTATFGNYSNADEIRGFSGAGRLVNNTNMTGIGFSASTGDVQNFTGRMYGIVNS